MLRMKDRIFSASEGAVASLVSPDGEFLLGIPVPQGETPAAYFLRFVGRGTSILFPDTVQVLSPPGPVYVSMPVTHKDSAAVPAVVKRVASHFEQMLERRLRASEMATARMLVELRARAGEGARDAAVAAIKEPQTASQPVTPADPVPDQGVTDAQQS